MFVISEIRDTIEIRAAATDKEESIRLRIIKKYVNKMVDELGLGIHLYKINNIFEYKISSENLLADVSFQMIFQRFYSDEVSSGKITAQDEDKIIIEDTMGIKYEVQAQDLFPECEFSYENGICSWIWNYKGNKPIFYNGDVVKFRIKRLRFQDTTVEAAMNDQGLGPSSWWD